jgi:hypothetical protein
VDQLAPSIVPVYGSLAEGREIWERCAERALPVIAVREGRRGFIVRYDLAHLDRELSSGAVRELRGQLRRWRRGAARPETHSQSQTVDLGGEVGPVSGDVHEATLDHARRLASRVSAVVLDRSNWR